MTQSTLADRLRMHRIDDATRQSLRELKPVLREMLPGALGEFYAFFGGWPKAAA